MVKYFISSYLELSRLDMINSINRFHKLKSCQTYLNEPINFEAMLNVYRFYFR